jgi:hypothetical protein
MQQVIADLSAILEKHYPLFKNMPVDIQIKKNTPDGWCKKQELGHLVDSAQNNIQRFIRVQYQSGVQAFYNPDEWVRTNNYLNMDWNDLVTLWYLLNKQVVRILSVMPASDYEKPIDVGAAEPSIHPTSFIADDYVLHMQHHLDHIFAA